MPDAAWLEIPDFTVRSVLDRYHPERLAPIFPGITHNNQRRVTALFYYGFSQLSTSEFLKREMEMHETKIHLLCGWSQIVIQKNTFPLQ